MSASTLLELADRCEAEEPSQELNEAIGRALGIKPMRVFAGGIDGDDVWIAYTTSLDAAVTLVPEGWMVLDLCQSARLFHFSLWRDSEPEDRAAGDAKTEALARCAAALRARAA